MDIIEKIKELKLLGKTVYSISRLNTVDECGWEYWQTYMEHLEPKDNIYGFTGGRIHKCLEDIQNGKEINFTKEIDNILDDAKFLDIKFPNDKIEEKWKKDIYHFAENYVKPTYKKVETEKMFLTKIGENYLQGIIDLLIYNDDGSVSIRDYKTSSKFSNSELESKGRQLILYGIAMEQLGFKVKDLAWEMLKYVEISYKLKNGNIRTTIAERGFIIDKLKTDIKKELTFSKQFTDLEIETMLEEAIEKNSFECLPYFIKNKYTIKDYVLYYDFSEENKKETINFINAKIEQIENFKDNEDWWTPKEINYGNSFYCLNLCNHRERCEYLEGYLERLEYIKSLEEERDNKELDDELLKFL